MTCRPCLQACLQTGDRCGGPGVTIWADSGKASGQEGFNGTSMHQPQIGMLHAESIKMHYYFLAILSGRALKICSQLNVLLVSFWSNFTHKPNHLVHIYYGML